MRQWVVTMGEAVRILPVVLLLALCACKKPTERCVEQHLELVLIPLFLDDGKTMLMQPHWLPKCDRWEKINDRP